MRKRFILTIIFIAFYNDINAQSTKALSFELGKTGIIYNIYYDQKFEKFGFRFGVGSNFAKYLNAKTFGGGIFYLIGKKKNFFETGAELYYLAIDEVSDDQRGFSFVFPDYTTKTFLANLNLGYRAYFGKILFRIGASPCVIKNEFIPGGYLSVGLVL